MRVLQLLLAVIIVIGLAGVAGVAPAATPTPSPTPPTVFAVVIVERAPVLPAPDRVAEPISYLFERERVPVYGRTPDGVFLRVRIADEDGWIVSAQAELEGDVDDLAVIGVTPTPTTTVTAGDDTGDGAARPTRTPLPTSTRTGAGAVRPTRTPLPTGTPPPPASATPIITAEPSATPEAGDADDTPDTADALSDMNVLPGVPPPFEIELPDEWKALHIVVPMRAFDNRIYDVPLSIYFGPLPDDVTGYLYVFWGYPTVQLGVGGGANPWADGLHILRGTFVDPSCNLGIDQQETFYVGDRKATGTFYTAVGCKSTTDTAGWFAALRVGDGNYAFFTAVEPLDSLPDQTANLQAILDTVEF